MGFRVVFSKEALRQLKKLDKCSCTVRKQATENKR